MIKFDPDLIRFEYVKLKAVSTALGGSVRIYNEQKSIENNTETTDHYKIPFAVARSFKVANDNISNFVVPVDGCIVWYNDQVVCIERHKHVMSNYYEKDADGNWISMCEHNYNLYVKPNVDNTWFTDGVFIYKLPENLDNAIEQATHLTNDGMFRDIRVNCYKYASMNTTDIKEQSVRSIVACISETTNNLILTPPIWSDVSSLRKVNINAEISGLSGESSELKKSRLVNRFDKINEKYAVNLEFALNAGKSVGKVFGYDKILPLQLDDLMIHLRTVNLPKVQPSTRRTFKISLSFLQAFAWVARLMSQCENSHDFYLMRSLMKNLCTKSLFIHNEVKDIHFDESNNAPNIVDPKKLLEMHNKSDTLNTSSLFSIKEKKRLKHFEKVNEEYGID